MERGSRASEGLEQGIVKDVYEVYELHCRLESVNSDKLYKTCRTCAEFTRRLD